MTSRIDKGRENVCEKRTEIFFRIHRKKAAVFISDRIQCENKWLDEKKKLREWSVEKSTLH
jgi:hypothetical protein